MKKTVVFLFLWCLFSSCSNEISKNDLQGTWLGYYNDNNLKMPFDEIRFEKDSVAFFDTFLFKEKGVFDIDGNNIFIQLERGITLKLVLDLLNRDSFVSSNNSTFYRDTIGFTQYNFDTYSLLDIKTNEFLDKSKISQSIHFYKDLEGKTHLRFGDKNTTMEDLSLFLALSCCGGQPCSPQDLNIFLGKGVKLIELKELYFYLNFSISSKPNIILAKSNISDYHIFKDDSKIWDEELEAFSKKRNLPPLPPPSSNNSKKKFLLQNPQQIYIHSSDDFNLLNNLNKSQKYLVSLNPDLEIKDYIALKIKIRNLTKTKNIKINTEILKQQ